MAILNFNYNQAINQARQIDNVATDMLSAANRQLQTTIESIGACWQGEASRQFIGYCTTTQTDIRAEAKKLQDLANRIREVARIIREAEERAKELQRQQAAAAAASSSGSGSGGGGGRVT
jgi:uncharacterized protein YukE